MDEAETLGFKLYSQSPFQVTLSRVEKETATFARDLGGQLTPDYPNVLEPDNELDSNTDHTLSKVSKPKIYYEPDEDYGDYDDYDDLPF